MGQINVEKNVGGIEGLCVITPAVHGDSPDPLVAASRCTGLLSPCQVDRVMLIPDFNLSIRN